MEASPSIRSDARPDGHLPEALVLVTGVTGQEGPEVGEGEVENTQRKSRPWAEGFYSLLGSAPWMPKLPGQEMSETPLDSRGNLRLWPQQQVRRLGRADLFSVVL